MPVYHYRLVLLTVLASIFKPKSFRQVPIDLDRPQLPNATDGVLDLNIDLWAIKRGLALYAFVFNIACIECACQLILGRLATFVRTEIYLVFGLAADRKLNLTFSNP